MKYEVAIFDMDGTILDTLEDLYDCLNYSLSTYDFPKRTKLEVRSFLGHGIRRLVERGVTDGATTEQIDNVFDLFNQHYAVHCADKTKPYDGIIELIKSLRQKSIKTAVVSNKTDYAVQSLNKQYFEGLFDFAVGAQEGIRKKPYPDSVNSVLDKFNLSSTQAVYIGDSEVDIETANNADMDCVLVDWGFRDREELVATGAKVIVSNMQELLEKIIQ